MSKDTSWTITHQDTTTQPYTWGTISASGWKYSGRDDEEDWSAWIDNNPPVIQRQRYCAYNEHDWADTGLAKTWCKKCDLNGRWVLGNVEIEHKEPK